MDLLEEVALLCFIYTQTKSPGIALVASLGALKAQPPQRKFMFEGYRRGKRAAWLPAIDWESLLDKPIDDVRALLRIDAPPVYEPVTSDSLRDRGQLAPRAA
jgi:ubiquinone biosynthesis protein COQ4